MRAAQEPDGLKSYSTPHTADVNGTQYNLTNYSRGNLTPQLP